MASKKKVEEAPKLPETPKYLDGFRVIALQIENVQKIEFARIRPAGNVVVLNGDNESGKTTVLESINWAMGGTTDIPTMPVKRGKKNAKISVDYGDLRVTRFFTAVDPEANAKGHAYISRIEVEERSSTDRNRFSVLKNPQAVLDALKSKISLDPLAFMHMAPKAQFEALRTLAPLDIDLDALAAKRKVAYDARRDAGRDVDNATARLNTMAEPPADLPAEPINVEELTRKLSSAANHNSQVEAAKTRKAGIEEQIVGSRNLARKMRADAYEILREAEKLDGVVIEIPTPALRPAAEYRVKELEQLRDTITIGESIDTDEVARELQNAQQVNAAIARAIQYRQAKKELGECQIKWAGLDGDIKKMDEDRAGAIARAKMPVEGLSIGDDEVMFEGLPFNQASSAQQIRISVMLGIAANPKLRVMYIQDGSLLGTKMMKTIEELAEEYNYQIWIERVDTTSKIGIMMEDGEASGAEVEIVK